MTRDDLVAVQVALKRHLDDRVELWHSVIDPNTRRGDRPHLPRHVSTGHVSTINQGEATMTKLQFRTASVRDMCQCDECTQKRSNATATNNSSPNDYAPPDPYAAGVKQLRAAEAPPLSTFADAWAEAGMSALAATRAALDAEASQRLRTLTAEELREFSPPDPYAEPLRRMREERR
jgi:hypothetical protein